MNKIVKALIGAAAVTAATVSHASAQICILFICLGKPSTPTAPTTPSSPPAAPEIDVTQGVAALAILICVALFLRERFLRQRTQA